ncbi:MAG: hypothetical protein AAF488_12930 [Planctomycetota bacterium]
MLILCGVLGLTIAAELLVWVGLLRWSGIGQSSAPSSDPSSGSSPHKDSLKRSGALFDLIVINAVTNPAANLAHWNGGSLLAIEGAVVVTETMLVRTLWKKSWRSSAGIALALNLASGSLSFFF